MEKINENEMRNMTCLAEGCIYPTSLELSGVNANEVIVGPTRSGKTTSIIEPRLLHTFEGSLIVNITKRDLADKYIPIFKKRGYRVLDLNLAEPKKGNVFFDPFDHLKNESDVTNLAMMLTDAKDVSQRKDPYWEQSATSMLAAIIGLTFLNAEAAGRKATFRDFNTLYRALSFNGGYDSETSSTSLDRYFDEAEERYPDNPYSRMWKTLAVNAGRTARCIFSTANVKVDKVMTPEVLEMMEGDKRVSFEELGSRKTVLFITTSPVNKAMHKLTDIFFSEAFKNLFEYAESRPNKKLPVPIHLICDDFATGEKIPDFDEYLSIFCAKGISVSLLLQSESQLISRYGDHEAVTIINNCDTYVYFGGMDHKTCESISKRINIPIDEVYGMPLEQVMVFRRGTKGKISRRYQTYRDPLYVKLFENKREKEREGR